MKDDKSAVDQGRGVNRSQELGLRERLQIHKRTMSLQQGIRV